MKNDMGKRSLSLAVACFTLVLLPSITIASTIALKATEDSVLLEASNTNNESIGYLGSELNTSAEGDIWVSVFKFDLSSLAGMNVNSATFELTSFYNHSEASFFHEIYSSSDDDWSENVITGVNRPINSSLTLLDSTSVNGVFQTYSWDVLAGVTGADGVAGTNDFLTLLLRPELSQSGSGGLGQHFYDREDPSQFPVLLIEASPVPVPAAVWLFASGLIGFVGIKRKLSLLSV